MSDNPLKLFLARHGVTDPEKFLIDSKAKVDHTPRIDGVPVVQETTDEYCARIEKKLRLF